MYNKILNSVFKNRQGTMEKKKKPSAFIRNMITILDRDDLINIVAWTEDGSGFIIRDLALFESEILPQYFKHQKYTSFVRQLNMYGFHKQKNLAHENYFQHEKYRRGNDICDIRRKPEKKKKTGVQKEGESGMANDQQPLSNNQSPELQAPIKKQFHEFHEEKMFHQSKFQNLKKQPQLSFDHEGENPHYENVSILCEQAIIQNRILRTTDKLLKQKSLELKKLRFRKLLNQSKRLSIEHSIEHTQQSIEEQELMEREMTEKLLNSWEILKAQTLKLNLQLDVYSN